MSLFIIKGLTPQPPSASQAVLISASLLETIRSTCAIQKGYLEKIIHLATLTELRIPRKQGPSFLNEKGTKGKGTLTHSSEDGRRRSKKDSVLYDEEERGFVQVEGVG
jgi:hypothetical protein